MNIDKMKMNVKLIFEEVAVVVGKQRVQQLEQKKQVITENENKDSDSLKSKIQTTQSEKIKSRTELIEQFPIDSCLDKKKQGKNKPILLQKLLQSIEQYANLSFSNTQISFLNKIKMYMKCGNYPLKQNIIIRPNDYIGQEDITIRVKNRVKKKQEIILDDQLKDKKTSQRKSKKQQELLNEDKQAKEEDKEQSFEVTSKFYLFMLNEIKEWQVMPMEEKENEQEEEQKEQLQQNISQCLQSKSRNSNSKRRRTKNDKTGRRLKERRIGYVVEKVIEWTKWSGKYRLNTNQAKKYNKVYSLQDAADYKVFIPKKTLDDYLFHISHGYKHRFNFNEHWTDRFAVLRNFVTKSKKDSKAKPELKSEVVRTIQKQKERRNTLKRVAKLQKLKQKQEENYEYKQ